MAAAMDLSEYEKDPRLFLFTSLTAGSSHIITATSRLETILKANKIPFQAIDTATDEKARRLWQRRAQSKKLPGLVKDGFVIGDLDEIEEWNEFGELKENIGPVPKNNAAPAGGVQGVNIRPGEQANPKSGQAAAGRTVSGANKAPVSSMDESKVRALPGAAEIAARNKAPSTSNPVSEKLGVETMASAPVVKEQSINAAKALLKDDHPSFDHLSAPPSAMQSGTATPQEEPEIAPSEGVGEAAPDTRHRGSEFKESSVDEINKIESENALKEGGEDGKEDGQDASKGIEALEINKGERPQDQDAKEPDDAGKSVQD
ncbi:hypothetical protein LTR37_015551 [Vermiconidia calcicola]|uniref:Uncharacterized protein n=1 Tax=Vermiconidia calcicola TaxID=1690605 RepID=A0ACC3MRK0_9PEZI|nr:hypothetical protein LTR37_015551 [Vermiconidia calcicola]